MNRATHRQPARIAARGGFTLVELVVVIAIIVILASILTTVAFRAIDRGKETAIKVEVNGLSQALEQYANKYGAYPPDFSSDTAVIRHFRTAFPRQQPYEMDLLENMMAIGGSFNREAVDRAEALVFALGGFSSDRTRPLTGPGGPFVLIDPANVGSDIPADYQYNTARENSFFPFESTRLTWGLTSSLHSYSFDEQGLAAVPAVDQEALDPVWSGGRQSAVGVVNDLMPVYLQEDGTLPYVYFHWSTYSVQIGSGSPPPVAYNYYVPDPTKGVARPYKSPRINTSWTALQPGDKALFYMAKEKYQIIAPGLDDHYGGIFAGPNGSAPQIVWVYPTGQGWNGDLVTAATGPPGGFSTLPDGYADNQIDPSLEMNFQLDNITSFSDRGTLGDALD